MSAILSTLSDDGVLTVTINRPERRNALDWDAWTGIGEAIARAEKSDVGAVVLTGAGGTFCAGGDLKSFGNVGDGVFASAGRLALAQGVLRALHETRKPVVAAVEGAAIGVGWSLALNCDFVVAAATAAFVAPFLERGLVPDGGIGWLLPRMVGTRRALEILLLHSRLTGEEALVLGLINRSVPAGEALSTAGGLAARMAGGPVETTGFVKALLRRAEEVSFATYLEAEREAFVLNQASGNPAEGIAAFMEKRAPNYRRR